MWTENRSGVDEEHWQSTGLSEQKLSEEKEERGDLGKKGQKGRLQRAAEGTKYLIRPNEMHGTQKEDS